MNGARTTFMRRGYLLTALAAVVLLAASPGTASAQVTLVDPPRTVDEAGSATFTVSATVTIPAETGAGAIVLSVTPAGRATPTAAETARGVTAGEDALSLTTPPNVRLNVPRNTRSDAVTRTVSGEFTWRTGNDADAEDEAMQLTLAEVSNGLVQTDGSIDSTAYLDGAGNALAIDVDGQGPLTGAVYPVVIDDSETQAFILRLGTRTPTEGDAISVTLIASPAPNQRTYPVVVAVDKPGYSPDTDSGTTGAQATANLATGAAATASISISTPATDGNRDSDTIVVTAVRQGTTSNLASPLEIEVADIHTLPAGDDITAMAYVDDNGSRGSDEAMSVMEGGAPVHLSVTVDRGTDGYPDNEELTVALVAADSGQAADFRVSPAEVTVPTGTGERTADDVFTVWALANDDVGAETLELSLVATGASARVNGSGESVGSFSIDIEDATDPMIWVKDGAYDAITMALGDAPLNPGDSVEIMTDDVFGLAQGYTASYGAAVEGDAVSAAASGAMVTVTASKAGEAKVTISGTAKMASSSLVINQTVANIAEVTFPVTVEDMPLEVTLEMPAGVMDGNIVEGESYDIMVMANRAITEAEGEVEVMIMRDRSKSDADDSDFTVSNATIMAGEDSATAELMVTEDMEPDSGTNDNMGEQLVLYGMAGDMETNSLTFTIWDQAVPALPLIAQLVLALFLALGGARLYRRRQG